MAITIKHPANNRKKILGTNLRVGYTVMVEGKPAVIAARDSLNAKAMIFGESHLTSLSFCEHYEVIEVEMTYKFVVEGGAK